MLYNNGTDSSDSIDSSGSSDSSDSSYSFDQQINFAIIKFKQTKIIKQHLFLLDPKNLNTPGLSW